MDKPEKETLSAFIKQKYPEIWEEYRYAKNEKRKEWFRNYMKKRYLRVGQDITQNNFNINK